MTINPNHNLHFNCKQFNIEVGQVFVAQMKFGGRVLVS